MVMKIVLAASAASATAVKCTVESAQKRNTMKKVGAGLAAVASLPAVTAQAPTCGEVLNECSARCEDHDFMFRGECWGEPDNRCLLCLCQDGTDLSDDLPLQCTNPNCNYPNDACPTSDAVDPIDTPDTGSNATEAGKRCRTDFWGNLIVPKDTTEPFICDIKSVRKNIIVSDALSCPAVIFTNLKYVGGNVIVKNNPNLLQLTLNDQQNENSLYIGGTFSVSNNENLLSIVGFNMAKVGGVFQIDSNPLLGQFVTPALQDVGGLKFDNNDQMVFVDMNSVQNLNGVVSISDNDKLQQFGLRGVEVFAANDLTGNCVEPCPSCTVTYNDFVEADCKGPEAASSMDASTTAGGCRTDFFGNLVVPKDQVLPFVCDIENVRGNIIVSDTTACPAVSFTNLKSVGGNIVVRNNPQLLQFNINDQQNENSVDVGGTVRIARNDILGSVVAFNLAKIGGEFQVESNPLLAQFVTPALEEVGGLKFNNNDNMRGLGLNGIQNVDGDIRITDNESLEQVGLRSLEVFAANDLSGNCGDECRSCTVTYNNDVEVNCKGQ